MAFNVGSLVGFVKIDHSGVKTGMQAADREVKAGMDRAGQSADKGGRDVGKRFGTGVSDSVRGSLKTLSAAIVGAFAVDRVVGFIGDSISAASNLEQSIGGVDAVFGEYADNVHTKSKQAAQDLGLSANSYNELITVSGALLKNKGISDFADQSQKLVGIGADLAAQFGGPTSQAVEALNAAMRGESDPIERYGISLNEAAVNAKMAEMGLVGLEGAALDQAKTQARLALITDQSADAIGAFAREGETAAGKAQRLSAEWENQQVALGQKLLPAMVAVTDFASGTLVPAFSSVVEVIAGVAGAVNGLPGPVKLAVGALIAFHLLKGPLSTMLDTTRTKVGTLAASMKGLSVGGSVRAGLGGLMGMLGGPWGMAIGGATAAIGYFMQAQADAEARVAALTETLDKQTGAFTDNSRATIREALMGSLSGEDQRLLQDLGISFTDLADRVLLGGKAVDDYILKLYLLEGAHPEATGALRGLTDEIKRQAPAAADAAAAGKALAEEEKNVGGEAGGAAPKVKDYKDVTDELKKKSQEAADKQKELAEAILEVSDAAIDADQANSDLADAFRDANEAADENGKTVNRAKTALDESTDAGKANGDALRGAAKDARDMAEANLYAGEETKKVKDRMGEAREEFIKAAEKMGLNRSAAEKLAEKYGLTSDQVDKLKERMDKIPKEKVLELKAETAQAKKDIQALRDQIALLKGKTITINVKHGTIRASGVGSSGPGRGFLEGSERFGGPLRKYAGGGKIFGAGTETSDSIRAFVRETGNMIAVSNKEFVANGSNTRRNEAELEAGNKGATLGVMTSGSQPSGPVELGPRTIRKLAQAMAGVRPVMDIDRVSGALAGD